MKEKKVYFVSNNMNHTKKKLKALMENVVRDITMIDSHLRGNKDRIRTLVWMREPEDDNEKNQNEKVFDLLDQCFNFKLRDSNVNFVTGTYFPMGWLTAESSCECIIVISDNRTFFRLLEMLYGPSRKKVSVGEFDEYVYEFRTISEAQNVIEAYGTFLEHKRYEPIPLIFDAYGTLASIHTNENDPDLWMILYDYIEAEIDQMKISPQELKELYFRKRDTVVAEKEMEDRYAEYDEREVFYRLLKEDLFASTLYYIDQELIEKIMRTYRILSRKYFKIHDHVAETLNYLKQKGYYPLVLLSNSQELYLQEEFREILPAFDLIFPSSKSGWKKPSKEAFNIATRFKGIKTENCIMIGDSTIDDIEPAKAMGMKTIYIVASQTDEPIPFEKADKVLDCSEFYKLPKVIEELEESM